MSKPGILKKLGSDVLVYGISTISSRLISFVLFPFFARKFSPEDYGVIGLLTNLSFVVGAIAGLGLDSAAARWFYDKDDTVYQKTAFTGWLWVQSGLLILISVLLMILSLVLPTAHYLQTVHPHLLLGLVLLNLLLSVPVQVANLSFVVRRKPMGSVIISLTSTGISTLASLILVFHFNLGLVGFYLGQTISFFISLILMLFMGLKHTFIRRLPSWSFVKPMIKYGVSIIPANISSYFLLFFSSVIIHTYTSQAQLGYYQIGYTLASGILLLTGPFNQAFQPLSFSVMEKPDCGTFYAGILDFYVMILCFVCLGVGLYLNDIIRLLLTTKYTPSALVAALLLFANFIYSINPIAVTGMAKEKKIKYFGIIVSISNGLILLLVWLGTKWLGIEGTAAGFILGYLLTIILLFVFSQRVFHVPYRLLENLLIILFGFGLFAFGFWSQNKLGVYHHLLNPILIFSFAALILVRNHRLKLFSKLAGFLH